jgi:hypothetical protein
VNTTGTESTNTTEPNLTRDRVLNTQNTTVVNNHADMKANLKSKLNERRNQQ